MTTDHTQLPTLAELRATLTERNRKYDQAMQDVVDGQLELLSATWAALEHGEATWPDLYAVAEQMREGNVGGWTVRWNEVVPVSWQKVQHLVASGQAPAVPAPRRSPAQYMSGVWTMSRVERDGQARRTGPSRGTYVVYDLMDSSGESIYIGCTGNFYTRLNAHCEKPWHKYVAREVRDKVDAEALEAVEILTKQPPLNKQLTSFGGARTLLAAAREGSLDSPDICRIAEVLHVDAGARIVADSVERYMAEKGTTWSVHRQTDPDDALWILGNCRAAMLTGASAERVVEILIEREQATAVAG